MSYKADRLILDHDFDNVKHNIKDIYRDYDDEKEGYEYGPYAVRPGIEEYTDKEVEDIIDKYTNLVEYGSDDFKVKKRTDNKCPHCNSVISKPIIKQHYIRPYSPIHLPDLPSSPVISTRFMPDIPDYSVVPRYRASTKTVRFNSDVDVKTFTPEPRELLSETESLPDHREIDDSRRIFLANEQRKLLLDKIAEEEERNKNRSDDVVEADYRFDDAMDKLGSKLKAFDD